MKKTIYKETIITVHDSGFGMYEAGEYNGDGWNDKQDLLLEIRSNVWNLYVLGKDELPEDIEDIRGKIYNEPGLVFATENEYGIQYGGIEEFEIEKYGWIKQGSDYEIYDINGQFIKSVWGFSTDSDTGHHNEFNTEVCVYKWTGEDCTVDELPSGLHGDWEAIDGFDFEDDRKGYADWENYADKLDEILAEVEGE